LLFLQLPETDVFLRSQVTLPKLVTHSLAFEDASMPASKKFEIAFSLSRFMDFVRRFCGSAKTFPSKDATCSGVVRELEMEVGAQPSRTR
jgi:hypothetical protein